MYETITDAAHPCTDTFDNPVALGQKLDFSDAPAVVLLANKGRLVEIGTIEGTMWKQTRD